MWGEIASAKEARGNSTSWGGEIEEDREQVIKGWRWE
jgi:hypothetical protein